MITEIRNKIRDVGTTVTSNFFYQIAPKGQSYPYCVYQFFAHDLDLKDTATETEGIYFQVTCYQRTDALCESLADSIETAFLAADMGTTNYTFLELRKIRRVPLPDIKEIQSKGLIIEFYLWVENK